jgi:ATP-dependent 26S proteasome regulatory subunit
VSTRRVEALREAVAAAPDNHDLRLMLAELLAEEGDHGGALAEYEILLDAGSLEGPSLIAAGRVALAAGRLDRAQAFADEASSSGVVEGVSELKNEINASLGLEGVIQIVGPAVDEEGELKPPRLELGSSPAVRFADVGGLTEVKKAIHRAIILPFERHDLYAKYGREAGGAALFYGPPGCGKTLLARATAGECSLPFSNIRIEDVLNPYFGVSEGRLHEAFAQARQFAPCVVFLDELDAIGFARRKYVGSAGRPLVDQLLQELDAIGSENENMLILAATNVPWDVDEALKRPGRFDRVVFVPPPDCEARERILELQLAGRPSADVDVADIARRTPLFSGADLGALVERAVDIVIDDALEHGDERPLTQKDLERALVGLRPSTLEWIATARNYVDFANQSGQYNEIAAFLTSPEARNWKD